LGNGAEGVVRGHLGWAADWDGASGPRRDEPRGRDQRAGLSTQAGSTHGARVERAARASDRQRPALSFAANGHAP
jgi:hypothetical protein